MNNWIEIPYPSIEFIEKLEATEPYARVEAVDRAYGWAAAYRIGGNHYVVVDDGARTTYFRIPERETLNHNDLYALLDNDYLEGIDRILQQAGLYGVESTPEADPDSDGPFWVLQTQFLEGHSQRTYAAAGPFDTFEEARLAALKLRDGDLHPVTGVVVLGNNEYSRPLYTIVSEE
jgi:hypothetical protein